MEKQPGILLTEFTAASPDKQKKPPHGWCRNLKIFWGPQEERNSPKSINIKGRIWQQDVSIVFLALRGLLKIQSEIHYDKAPEKPNIKELIWEITPM